MRCFLGARGLIRFWERGSSVGRGFFERNALVSRGVGVLGTRLE